MYHGWRQVDGDWLLLDGEDELGRVHEQLLGWSWVVRNGSKGAVMGMAPSRSDAMLVVERRLGIPTQRQAG
jgi:hypothetical protein